MKDKQNEFYSSISKYYADIFPYQPMQLQFVKSRVGEMAGKQILDIGCATGELAFQMAKEGAIVTGIDLNEDLLQQAIGCSGFRSADSSKRELEFASPNPKFQVGNMLNLESDFQPGQFDAVLCFGNTLVHLHTLDLMQQMLNGVYSVLKPGGQFLMQILNYDYILNENVTELPLIDTENIRFIRNYGLEENNPLIRFQTQLEIKKEDRIVSNETLLFALKSGELVSLLKTSGFKNIELFSNFKQETFGGKHLPLVVRCFKQKP
jgi:2-polyprenyl-3-methyl-5-hydroxy-6-metoxy-1,4-benzoquinol methylase